MPGTARSRSTVVVIPARGGSKGVPGKNLRRVGGRSLIERAIDACRAVATIDRVVVSTDDDGIGEVAVAAGAEVVVRPAELSGDEASSESAVLHACDALELDDDDLLVFVQCTSPFIDADSLATACRLVDSGEFDTAFSATASFDFVWRIGESGLATGVNHDERRRLRRQDRLPSHIETGAFYVMWVGGLRRHGHRFHGRIGIAEVPAWTSVEIDDPVDLELASAIDQTRAGPEAIDGDLVVTDFDGVHTDDRVLVLEDGREGVVANRSDGMGIEMLRAVGVELLILSREDNPVVRQRADKLRVECLHGVRNKWSLLSAFLADRGVPAGKVVYVGNDVNDLECMEHVGWPVAVADAHPTVRTAARVVLGRRGGDGAVREVAERVVAARGSR